MKLIDADEENGKLLDFIAENDSSIRYAIEHKDMTILEDIFFEYFEAQKIVYDVDKVVEQIYKEQEREFVNNEVAAGDVTCSDVIEIVKAGGVNE